MRSIKGVEALAPMLGKVQGPILRRVSIKIAIWPKLNCNGSFSTLWGRDPRSLPHSGKWEAPQAAIFSTPSQSQAFDTGGANT